MEVVSSIPNAFDVEYQVKRVDPIMSNPAENEKVALFVNKLIIAPKAIPQRSKITTFAFIKLIESFSKKLNAKETII